MRIIEPTPHPAPKQRRPKRPFFIGTLVVVFIAATVNYARPLPTPVASVHITLPAAAGQPSLQWPAQGQAAAAASDYGSLGVHGTMEPLATASIAKVITALCVLEKQPLSPGQSGPTYTIGPSDVALYQAYAAEDGSLIAVTQGEKLTEYQALEALMIPSANNIADSLVRWVFGSQSTYAAYAAHFLSLHGLSQTHIGPDASGFDPGTISTAGDLTQLGALALQNPTLMEIAGKRSTALPGVGTVYNYDTMLGTSGITGLKTGNNDADPGAFLFTANVQIDSKTIPVTGAVMDAPDLHTALQNSAQLVDSLQQGFEPVSAASAGQSVGNLHAAWGASSSIIAKNALQLVRWRTNPVTEVHQIDTRVRSGTIGNLKILAGRIQAQTPLALGKPLAGPSFWWRLTRR